MAFRLRVDESPRKGLRRIVRDQITEAIEGLAPRDGSVPDDAVHDARKRFKKVRAALRLAEVGLGKKVFEREDARFRDAGHPLAEARDAGVLVAVFDALIARHGDQGLPGEVAAIRAGLLDRKDEASRRMLGDATTLADLIASIEEARDAMKGDAFDGITRPALAEGLRRIYRRGRRAFRAAVDAPTDENLHRWRKRVKDLGYALAILSPIRPSFTRRRASLAGDLADLLGDDHDLAVLRQALATLPDGDGRRAAADRLLPRIDRRRAGLRRDAFRLGARVYREKPAALIDRLDASWRAWRSQVEAT